MRLVYSAEAIDDLKRLRAFIAENNPTAAHRIAAVLMAKIELLPTAPKMGIPVQSAPVPADIRDMIFGKYIVRYSLHASTIIVLRVWHGLENDR